MAQVPQLDIGPLLRRQRLRRLRNIPERELLNLPDFDEENANPEQLRQRIRQEEQAVRQMNDIAQQMGIPAQAIAELERAAQVQERLMERGDVEQLRPIREDRPVAEVVGDDPQFQRRMAELADDDQKEALREQFEMAERFRRQQLARPEAVNRQQRLAQVLAEAAVDEEQGGRIREQIVDAMGGEAKEDEIPADRDAILDFIIRNNIHPDEILTRHQRREFGRRLVRRQREAREEALREEIREENEARGDPLVDRQFQVIDDLGDIYREVKRANLARFPTDFEDLSRAEQIEQLGNIATMFDNVIDRLPPIQRRQVQEFKDSIRFAQSVVNDQGPMNQRQMERFMRSRKPLTDEIVRGLAGMKRFSDVLTKARRRQNITNEDKRTVRRQLRSLSPAQYEKELQKTLTNLQIGGTGGPLMNDLNTDFREFQNLKNYMTQSDINKFDTQEALVEELKRRKKDDVRLVTTRESVSKPTIDQNTENDLDDLVRESIELERRLAEPNANRAQLLRNFPYTIKSLKELAKRLGINPEDLRGRTKQAIAKDIRARSSTGPSFVTKERVRAEPTIGEIRRVEAEREKLAERQKQEQEKIPEKIKQMTEKKIKKRSEVIIPNPVNIDRLKTLPGSFYELKEDGTIGRKVSKKDLKIGKKYIYFG